ncbi:maleylacetoacetate isomerase [Sphingorhabdus sp.]|jgi:maleylacetoacetate isomerase|uniref:maleylacetoacetate isomerase n=1 Tax=Sphingorhabdus sp. TaxID=1902408 RepID=UPI0037CC39D5
MVILHEYALSSASFRVRIALNLKGVEYESKSYSLRAGEQRSPGFLELNPARLVPCLEIDGLRLSQSIAVIEYLDARYPDPQLIPSDPAERAVVQAMALDIACDIHPLNNLRVLKYLEDEMGQSEQVRNRWYTHWVHAGFSALETIFRSQPEHQFAAGDTISLADVCLVPQVFNARRYNIEMAAYPRLSEINARAAALPAFVCAAPVQPSS